MDSPRDLITLDLFNRLSGRVMKEDGCDRDYAERVVDQALVFLVACAENPGWNLGPSTAADAGWHAFILHTREYAEFCHRVAGRFMHHAPTVGDTSHARTLELTLAAMHATGYEVDEELWSLAGNCDGKPRCNATCHHGCHDVEDD